MSKPKKNYFIIEYISEIVDANTKEEAIVMAKQRIQDRDVEVDDETPAKLKTKTC